MANGQPRPAFYVAVLLVVVGLVERVTRQVSANKSHVQKLEA